MDRPPGPPDETLLGETSRRMMRVGIALAALLAATPVYAECSTDLSGNWRAYLHYSGTGSTPRACALTLSATGRVTSGTCWHVPGRQNQGIPTQRSVSQLSASGNCVVSGRIYLPGCNCTLVFNTGSLTGAVANGLGYEVPDNSPNSTSIDFSFALARH